MYNPEKMWNCYTGTSSSSLLIFVCEDCKDDLVQLTLTSTCVSRSRQTLPPDNNLELNKNFYLASARKLSHILLSSFQIDA